MFAEARERVIEERFGRARRDDRRGRPAWHRGVLGIAASRLAREYHRPVMLFGIEGDKACGSGRSIPGVSLHGVDEISSPFPGVRRPRAGGRRNPAATGSRASGRGPRALRVDRGSRASGARERSGRRPGDRGDSAGAPGSALLRSPTVRATRARSSSPAARAPRRRSRRSARPESPAGCGLHAARCERSPGSRRRSSRG